jgi:hypothetical protein
LAALTSWSSISDEKSDQSSPNVKWRSVIVVPAPALRCDPS